MRGRIDRSTPVVCWVSMPEAKWMLAWSRSMRERKRIREQEPMQEPMQEPEQEPEPMRDRYRNATPEPLRGLMAARGREPVAEWMRTADSTPAIASTIRVGVRRSALTNELQLVPARSLVLWIPAGANERVASAEFVEAF
jgi:hypothetical protein